MCTALGQPDSEEPTAAGPVSEPTLADVQAEFSAWRCSRGISGLYYALNESTGKQVSGEDPLDLRDQIKAAQARHSYGA